MRPLILCILLSFTMMAKAQDPIILRPVKVEARLAPVTASRDTLLFNVQAFIGHQGERLRSLLQKLPGVEVLYDGTIKARGREVEQFLINGRRLTGLKEDVLLSNLRVEMLSTIKLYDLPTIEEEEMGVVRGNEHQVMDLITEDENPEAWLCDVTAGYGTHDRFEAGASASQFTSAWQNMFTAKIDNQPGAVGVGESFYDKLQRTLPTADARRINVCALTGWESGDWKVQGNAYYDNIDSKECYRGTYENILPGMESRLTSTNSTTGRTQTASVQVGIEWHDESNSIHIDPYFTFTKDNERGEGLTTTANERDMVLNRRRSLSLYEEKELSGELNMRVNHKFTAREGRNIDVTVGLSSLHNSGNNADGNDVDFVQQYHAQHDLRLSDVGIDKTNARLRIAYVEPLTKLLKLHGEYAVTAEQQEADEPVYITDNSLWGVVKQEALLRSDSLSRYAQSRSLDQQGRVNLHFVKGRLRITVGAKVNACATHTKYDRNKFRLDTVRHTMDWSPEMHLTWRSNAWSITAGYDGRTQHPSVLNLIPVDNTSDPLNIRCGNPGLRNSFTHSLTAGAYYFNAEHEQQFNVQLSGDVEQHALAQYISYDAAEGIRRFTTINADGNRRMACTLGFQSAMGREKYWYVDVQADASVCRRVGRQDVDGGSPFDYATTQSQASAMVALQYKRCGFSCRPYTYGRVDALHSDLAGAIERRIKTLGYGGVLRYESSCGLSAAIDAYNNVVRGYVEPDMNRDEFIIDAEISYAFLRNRNAEIGIVVCDLLGNRSMVQGYTYTSGRSEYRHERSVNSYAMATFTYRF